MSDCAFCNQPLSDGQKTVTLTQKGCDGINQANLIRQSPISVAVGQQVHMKCRKDYINPNVIERDRKRSADAADVSQGSSHHLRSAEPSFSYQDQCLFCGCGDSSGGRQDARKLIPVRSIDLQYTILEACKKYEGSWADIVKQRIIFVHDLHAADAVYHNICSINFRTGKQIPKLFLSSEGKPFKRVRRSESVGRPKLSSFCEKTTSSTASVEPQTIPPTSAAVKFHSLRVYYQIQVGLGINNMHPEEWGWKVSDGRMLPVTTDVEPAPQELLEVIRCSCKTGCHTLRCSCRKNGLDCTFACGQCRGICTNMTAIESEEEL